MSKQGDSPLVHSPVEDEDVVQMEDKRHKMSNTSLPAKKATGGATGLFGAVQRIYNVQVTNAEGRALVKPKNAGQFDAS